MSLQFFHSWSSWEISRISGILWHLATFNTSIFLLHCLHDYINRKSILPIIKKDIPEISIESITSYIVMMTKSCYNKLNQIIFKVKPHLIIWASWVNKSGHQRLEMTRWQAWESNPDYMNQKIAFLKWIGENMLWGWGSQFFFNILGQLRKDRSKFGP